MFNKCFIFFPKWEEFLVSLCSGNTYGEPNWIEAGRKESQGRVWGTGWLPSGLLVGWLSSHFPVLCPASPCRHGYWVPTLATSWASSGAWPPKVHHTGFLQALSPPMLLFLSRPLSWSPFLWDTHLSPYLINSYSSLGTRRQQFFPRESLPDTVFFPTRIRSPITCFLTSWNFFFIQLSECDNGLACGSPYLEAPLGQRLCLSFNSHDGVDCRGVHSAPELVNRVTLGVLLSVP